jgi:hypothetical protein
MDMQRESIQKVPIEIAIKNEVIFFFNRNGFVKAGRYRDIIRKYLKKGYTAMMERIKDFQNNPDDYR